MFQQKVQLDFYREQLLPWHKILLDDWASSQYKILAAGRKARKTTFIVNELMINAMLDKRGLTYPMIGPTRIQEKEIVWDDHVEQILRILIRHKVPFQKNNGDLSIRFPGYGKFTVDGGDNIESLRGKSDWGMIGLDEFAAWSNPRYAWEEVIEPNLLVHKAPAMIGSTSRGYDYFHLLMKRGDHQGKIEGDAFNEDKTVVVPNRAYKSYRFTSYDNPHLDVQWLENKKLTMPEDAFNREYMAKFERYTGLIYKEFSRSIHVIDSFNVPVGWDEYGAMDFGATNPTVHLWIRTDKENNVYVVDEYYMKGQNTQFHCNVIKARTQSRPIVCRWGDPSGEQEMLDYGNEGIYITPAVKIFDGEEQGWVKSGISKVQQMLKPSSITGKPKLFIFRNCGNLIREFESYQWLEPKSVVSQELNDKEVPLKANDHGMDALRYFICSHFASSPITDTIYT